MNCCVFCNLDQSKAFVATENVVGVFDDYPTTPGHTLIAPYRHIHTIEELFLEEEVEIWNVIRMAKSLLKARYGNIKGWNIGVNEGKVAGQTLDHLHFHLIPRFEGDVEDPSGGIRNILKESSVRW